MPFEPELTIGLPAHITAATGIDAFIHSLEAYFAPGFHPMADGIAVEGMKLVIKNLEKACLNGKDLEARSQMLLAASMGATAFQKGLGMIHSIAHPLSSVAGLHHGLANALVAPASVNFLEQSDLTQDQKARLAMVNSFFVGTQFKKENLSETLKAYFSSLGVNLGLLNHGITKEKLDLLSHKAFLDVCHSTNMVPMSIESFKHVIEKAL